MNDFLTMEYIKVYGENLFFLSFSIYLIICFWASTLWPFPDLLLNILRLVVGVLLIIRLIFVLTSFQSKQFFLFSATLCLVILSVLGSEYTVFFIPFLLVVAAKNVSFSKIIKVYFVIGCVFLVSTIIASHLGIVETRDVFRASSYKVRSSFGFVYATDFAAHVFYLLLALWYIKKGKLGIVFKLFYFLSAFCIYQFCDARLDSICIVLIVLSSSLFYKSAFDKYKILRFLYIYSIPIGALVIILLTYIYTESNMVLFVLNILLTGRLSLGNRALVEDGVKLFGQPYEQRGMLSQSNDEYNFIDSSFVLVLVIYGAVLFTMLLLSYIYICRKMYQNGNSLFLQVTLLIVINSLLAHHLIDVSYNPFILALLSSVDSVKVRC